MKPKTRPSLPKQSSSFFQKLKLLVQHHEDGHRRLTPLGKYIEPFDENLTVEDLMKRYNLTEEELEKYWKQVQDSTTRITP